MMPGNDNYRYMLVSENSITIINNIHIRSLDDATEQQKQQFIRVFELVGRLV